MFSGLGRGVGGISGVCAADKTSSFGNGAISGKWKLCGVVWGVARALRGGFRRTVIVPGHRGEVFGSIVLCGLEKAED